MTKITDFTFPPLFADNPFGDNLFGTNNVFGSIEPLGDKLASASDQYNALFAAPTQPFGLGEALLAAPQDCYYANDSITHTVNPSTIDSYAFIGSTKVVDPAQGLISRIERLEREVELFKAAALALKEINDERRRQAQQPAEDPISAYERAKRAVL